MQLFIRSLYFMHSYKQSGSLSGQSSENDEHPTLYPSDDNVVSSGETPSEDTKQPASSIDLDTTNNNTLYDSLKLLCPGVGHEVKKCFRTSCSKLKLINLWLHT